MTLTLWDDALLRSLLHAPLCVGGGDVSCSPRLLAPALHVSYNPTVAEAFANTCDLTGAGASARDRAHATAHGDEREVAVALLRDLDQRVLGGVLEAAERALQPLVRKRQTRQGAAKQAAAG